MAIYQPGQVVPDVRSGLGLGVVDATQPLEVSWRIHGPSALTSFSITIYENNTASTQKYSTGQISTGCPAYGTTNTGEPQFFSYTIPAASLSSLSNGNEYKLIIKQWWNNNAESITQSSASVFLTRAAPTLSIAAIGSSSVIATRFYTFTGNYTQAQGDVLNWFRWQIARADDTANPFYDTENVSGTMNISCYYDGFFTGTNYAVRLTAQTENGVELDTGWVNFSAAYAVTDTFGEITAGCVGGTDAVVVEWTGIGYIPGVSTGANSFSMNGSKRVLDMQAGASVTWSSVGTSPMSFAAPWTVIWSGILTQTNGNVFTIAQSGGNIVLSYSSTTRILTLSRGSTVLATSGAIGYLPTTVTVVITATKMYVASRYLGGGLVPSETLYPSNTLYPKDNTSTITSATNYNLSYTQQSITSVAINGVQTCNYIEVVNGTVGAEIISEINAWAYTPGLSTTDYMLADFSDYYNAGTLSIGGDTLQGFALYRMRDSEETLVKIAETDATTGKVYDYSALNGQGIYTYYLFPIGTNTYISSPLVSGGVNPCWWNYTLMECQETSEANIFTVLSAFRFRYNVESGAVSNNNSPSILQNFTPYPKIQVMPQNYKSATLGGLIGAVDWSSGQPQYMDTLTTRDAIYALSISQNPLFLKTRKGELIRVKVGGAISMQTADATKEQMQTMSLPWIEIGNAENVGLYSLTFASIQEPEGEYTPQYAVDGSDATADAEDILLDKTAYGVDGKIIGAAQFTVDGTTLVAP